MSTSTWKRKDFKRKNTKKCLSSELKRKFQYRICDCHHYLLQRDKENKKNQKTMLESTHHRIRRIYYDRYIEKKFDSFTQAMFIMLSSTRLRLSDIPLNLQLCFQRKMINEPKLRLFRLNTSHTRPRPQSTRVSHGLLCISIFKTSFLEAAS